MQDQLTTKEQNRFDTAIKESNTVEDIFHLGVKTFIRNNNNEILILKVEKDTKSYWDLPGGRVQINEDLKTTVFREIKEETGITVLHNMHHICMLISNIRIPIDNEKTVGLIFSFYSAKVETTTIVLSPEHQYYNWVLPQRAMELLEPIYRKALISLIK